MDNQTANGPENDFSSDAMVSPAPEMQGGDATSEVVRKRLAQQNAAHQRQLDQIRAEKEALHAQLQHAQSQIPQQGNQQEQMIPLSALPEIQKQLAQQEDTNRRYESVHQKVSSAAEQDPELQDLLQKGNPIGGNDLALMGKLSDLPNIPAVIKKLLKDKNEHAIFTSASSDFDKMKYIRDLSEKLDGRADNKQKFVPAEQISGSSPVGSNYDRFVDKYKGRKAK